MKCSFSRLLYPKKMEEARDGSYMIALFRPREKVLDAQGNRLNSINVVGHFLPTADNINVDMTGHWNNDARFGLQFEMESYEEIVGPDKRSIVAYLSSGMFPGIGSTLAERIYDTFGERTLDVLDQDPARVEDVPGISKKKREQFCTAYFETRSARKLICMLAPFNITAPQAIKLRQKLGSDAQELIMRFPYKVFEYDLIDFEIADQLAQANGIPLNAPERLEAGLLYTLILAEHEGHLCLHKAAFVRRAVDLLHAPAVTWKVVAQRAFEMIQTGRLVLYNDYVYRPIMAQAEREVAGRLCNMLKCNRLPYMGELDDEIDEQQAEVGFNFADEQRHAIRTALTSPICIISGGPGTGKTSIQRAILNIFKNAFPDSHVVCCAPTGRAARRMEQSTGYPASTIHKVLNLTAGEVHELKTVEMLDADLVLVDEVSMMDMVTAWCLFNALPPGCRLILVGDADQLPSVGPGAVLNELLSCGRIPAVILDKVFRQSEGSLIAENAQRIRHGLSNLEFGADFQFWASADDTQSAQLLMQLYKMEVDRFGVDNVALLTPFRKKSETGVCRLNAELHGRINPASPEKSEIEVGQRILRVGDKVMQMKNRDFASNGDIGYICTSSRNSDGFLIEVDFGDGRVVAYEDTEALRQLELAYANTIHKSQGSEYDSVLINIQNMHGKMLNRALFYTAETRAKKHVIIVGDWEAVVRAIQTADTKLRHTRLALRINDLIKE